MMTETKQWAVTDTPPKQPNPEPVQPRGYIDNPLKALNDWLNAKPDSRFPTLPDYFAG